MNTKIVSDRLPRRHGVTIVELIVVITVIGIVIAISASAILNVRESGRQVVCLDRLRQSGLACQSYVAATGRLPHSLSPTPLKISLLPYLELEQLYTDLSRQSDTRESSRAFSPPKIFLCPSDAANLRPAPDGVWATNYIGNAGTGWTRAGFDGLFGGSMATISMREIADGLSNTSLMSECLVSGTDLSDPRRLLFNLPLAYPDKSQFEELMQAIATAHLWGAAWHPLSRGRGRPWTDGNDHFSLYHHGLPPNSNSAMNGTSVVGGLYSAASDHARSVNMAFADGSITRVSDQISLDVWWALGSRAGREAGFLAD
jgi:prepilin-type N-terminal cleavage/methylation domain-containing protein/prepilin-type processing-associated H-X9-DG protein